MAPAWVVAGRRWPGRAGPLAKMSPAPTHTHTSGTPAPPVSTGPPVHGKALEERHRFPHRAGLSSLVPIKTLCVLHGPCVTLMCTPVCLASPHHHPVMGQLPLPPPSSSSTLDLGLSKPVLLQLPSPVPRALVRLGPGHMPLLGRAAPCCQVRAWPSGAAAARPGAAVGQQPPPLPRAPSQCSSSPLQKRAERKVPGGDRPLLKDLLPRPKRR